MLDCVVILRDSTSYHPITIIRIQFHSIREMSYYFNIAIYHGREDIGVPTMQFFSFIFLCVEAISRATGVISEKQYLNKVYRE